MSAVIRGTGKSFIVCKPGADDSTFGIELTTIEAVAMSPGTPPGILSVRFGTPCTRTSS